MRRCVTLLIVLLATAQPAHAGCMWDSFDHYLSNVGIASVFKGTVVKVEDVQLSASAPAVFEGGKGQRATFHVAEQWKGFVNNETVLYSTLELPLKLAAEYLVVASVLPPSQPEWFHLPAGAPQSLWLSCGTAPFVASQQRRIDARTIH